MDADKADRIRKRLANKLRKSLPNQVIYQPTPQRVDTSLLKEVEELQRQNEFLQESLDKSITDYSNDTQSLKEISLEYDMLEKQREWDVHRVHLQKQIDDLEVNASLLDIQDRIESVNSDIKKYYSVEPTNVEPELVDEPVPTSLEPTSLEPTSLEPTSLEPTIKDRSESIVMYNGDRPSLITFVKDYAREDNIQSPTPIIVKPKTKTVKIVKKKATPKVQRSKSVSVKKPKGTKRTSSSGPKSKKKPAPRSMWK